MALKVKSKCKYCGRTFERDASITKIKCPHCGKENLYYPIQIGSIRFWYM